jgi:GT2 family glycosyltransferase
VNEVPPEILELLRKRRAAREKREFTTADALRDRINRAGFDVIDTPDGTEVTVREEERNLSEPAAYRSSEAVPSALDAPPRFDASIQWLVEGWPADALRGIESVRRYAGARSIQYVVVDLTSGISWPPDVEVVRVSPEIGWAGGRNGGLRRAEGRIVVIVDGSVEALGDVIGPLEDALTDPEVGLTGPFGIVTDDLREFRDSTGPDVDAVEGYLMALRRDLLESGLRFDERFKFYRTADIEFSFQVKATGCRVTVTELPVKRHEHRMWANTQEDQRARLSKRNYYRFLDRWRGRTDLLSSRIDDEAR